MTKKHTIATCISAALLLAVGTATIVRTNPPSVSPLATPSMLSIEQTLGAIFITPDRTPFALFARANPEAKPGVYRVLGRPEDNLYHENCVYLLGFMGDKSDLPRLEAYAAAAAKREVLDKHACFAVKAIPAAIAALARRDVEGASNLLERMTTRSYWDAYKFKSFPVLPANVPDVSWELASFSVYASSFVSADYARQTYEKCLAAEDDLQVIEYHKKRFPPDSLAAVSEQFEKDVIRPVSEDTLLGLKVRSNNDLENPQFNRASASEHRKLLLERGLLPTATDPPSKLSADKEQELVQEAVKAFRRLNDTVAAGQMDAVWDQVFDASNRIPNSAPAELAAQLKQALTKVKPIAAAVKNAKLNTDTANVKVQSLKSGNGTTEVNEVRIELPQTRDALERHWESGAESTINLEKQCLMVIMRKANGRWFWHPFGW